MVELVLYILLILLGLISCIISNYVKIIINGIHRLFHDMGEKKDFQFYYIFNRRNREDARSYIKIYINDFNVRYISIYHIHKYCIITLLLFIIIITMYSGINLLFNIHNVNNLGEIFKIAGFGMSVLFTRLLITPLVYIINSIHHTKHF